MNFTNIDDLLAKQDELLEKLRQNTELILKNTRKIIDCTSEYKHHVVVESVEQIHHKQLYIMKEIENFSCPTRVTKLPNFNEKIEVNFRRLSGEIFVMNFNITRAGVAFGA